MREEDVVSERAREGGREGRREGRRESERASKQASEREQGSEPGEMVKFNARHVRRLLLLHNLAFGEVSELNGSI